MLKLLRRALGISVVLWIAASGPARATPPHVAFISDLPLGHTDTHLFLLRTVDDNTGSHYAALVHQFLIKQNIRTGAAERHWPVRRLHYTQRFDWPRRATGEPELSSQVIAEPPQGMSAARFGAGDLVDPFAKMAEQGAVPLSTDRLFRTPGADTRWEISEQAGLVRVSTQAKDALKPGERLLRRERIFGQLDLKAKIRNSLFATKSRMPQGSDHIDAMGWRADSISVDLSACQITGQFSMALEIRDTFPRYAFAALQCESEADVFRWTIWLGWPES